MKFGLTRYGPSAPLTFQFGKYDTLTSTGTPTSSTENDTVSEVISMSVTSAVPVACRGGSRSVDGARGQSSGPEVASSTSQRDGSLYQSTAGPGFFGGFG